MQGKQGIVVPALQMPLHGARYCAPLPSREGAGVKPFDSLYHRFEKRQCLLGSTVKAGRQLDVVAFKIDTRATMVRRVRGLKQEPRRKEKLHWYLHRLLIFTHTAAFTRRCGISLCN